MAKKDLLPDSLLEEVALRFRALSEPIRLRILRHLQAGEASVNDVAAALSAGQSNVSRHLQALHEAGLVARRREGNAIFYSIADPMVFELCHLICDSTRRSVRAKLVRLTL
jgi:DNA-binding transcriptional ArsR family regulator